MHTHDIEAPCGVACPAYDPAAWRCQCGSGCMLADTEGWQRPMCFECWQAAGEPAVDPARVLN